MYMVLITSALLYVLFLAPLMLTPDAAPDTYLCDVVHGPHHYSALPCVLLQSCARVLSAPVVFVRQVYFLQRMMADLHTLP